MWDEITHPFLNLSDVKHSLAMVSLNIYSKWRKHGTQRLVEKKRFEIKYKTEDHGQSVPKSIETITVLGCIFGPTLEIFTSINENLQCVQAENG